MEEMDVFQHLLATIYHPLLIMKENNNMVHSNYKKRLKQSLCSNLMIWNLSPGNYPKHTSLIVYELQPKKFQSRHLDVAKSADNFYFTINI